MHKINSKQRERITSNHFIVIDSCWSNMSMVSQQDKN